MICFEDKLDSAINGTCPTVLGMENNGYLLLRSDVANRSITDFVASFIPTSPAIPVYHPLNDLAYKPKSEGTTNGYGLTKFEKSIELFILANTELSQTQVMQLKNGNSEWVFIGKQKDSQIVVFGFERGLKLKTSMQEFNSLETHGGIVLTFDETSVNTPMLFSNALSISYFAMDMIYGGTIANGGAVKLTIDSEKVGYVRLPNGGILETVDDLVSSIIDTTYSGVGGKITIYTPKNNTDTNIDGSDIAGTLTCNADAAFSFAGCMNIVGVISENGLVFNFGGSVNMANLVAPKATTIYGSGCALTAKSIGDILYQAYIDNRANVDYYFNGGTNADLNSVDIYMMSIPENTMGIGVDGAVDILTDLGGDIQLNP